ncbi:MAG: signal peptide peptidase SppA [Myxococcales bacterium]
MRLLLTVLWNCLAAAVWPLRALARLAFGHPAPEWIEVRLRGPLADFSTPRPFWRRRLAPSGRSLPSLREAFEAARRARSCRGVVLRVEHLHGSAAQLTALATLIAELRKPGDAGEPGKEVIVWAENLEGRSYAALCGATRLHLPPGGALDLTGAAVELTAAGTALARLGIRPEFFRREEHKTAPELFTRAEPSAVQRATAGALLDQSFESFIEALGRRGLDAASARALVDGGPYLGKGAARAGLIDRPLFWDELLEKLSPPPKRGKGREPSLAGERRLLRSGRRAQAGFRSLRPKRTIAVVPLRGIIRTGRSSSLPGAGRFCGSDSIAVALRRARESARVAAVLLYVDSRGGSASASEILWHEIRRTAKQKPVLAYVDGVAASGGYYAACGAQRLLGAPLSLVGSIGVFFGRFDVSEALGRLGIHEELLVRGAHAGLAWPSRPLTPAEREAADALVAEIYEDFVSAVAQARGRKVEEILPLAGGRVYTGRAAHGIGLLDGVAGFEDALRETASLGGLEPGRRPEIVVLEDAMRGPAALAALSGTIQALARPQAFAYHLGPHLP